MIGTYHRNARVRAALLLLALVCAPVFASAERVALVVGKAARAEVSLFFYAGHGGGAFERSDNS